MKTTYPLFSLATGLMFLAGPPARAAEPLLDSWYVQNSGRYARIYASTADQNSGTTKTTWSQGVVNQAVPAYSGVYEISYSASWVYIRTTGLGFHNMGPWYLDANKTQLFPNFPGNTATLWRFPRTPAAAVTPTLTSLGAIGYFVDGVAMFDGQDGYYWNGTAEAQSGTGGLWNRDAYPEEGVSFDPGNAHQEQTGTYHYHANPLGLRFQLGDNVSYNSGTKKWVENVGAPTKHSPLLGWVRDGYPIYGPYGYSSALDANSGVRRMTTGYVLRNGQSNTVNLATSGRITLPAWAARGRSRSATLAANEYGPGVAGIYTVGRYHEDYEYLGDTGYTQGTHFDLDEHNGRFCVTPEFPGGTYAYFMTINASGTPVYPYNIGRVYYGNPTGGAVTTLSETVTTNFVGGASAALTLAQPAVAGNITLTWSAVEGGTYRIEKKASLADLNWSTVVDNLTASSNVLSQAAATNADAGFYRVVRTAIATYSTTTAYTGTTGGGGGGGTGVGITSVTPTTAARGATVTLTINLDAAANPPLPPSNAPLPTITLGAINGTGISRNNNTLTASFTIPGNATTGPQTVTVTFAAPPGQGTGPVYTYTSVTIQ
jgi:hypothetical protein